MHKSLVRAEAAALSPQCREASGLSADSLARAESLDKVLQQVSVGAYVGGGTAKWQAHDLPPPRGRERAGEEARRTRPTGTDRILFETLDRLPRGRVLGHSQRQLTFQPLHATPPAEGVDNSGRGILPRGPLLSLPLPASRGRLRNRVEGLRFGRRSVGLCSPGNR